MFFYVTTMPPTVAFEDGGIFAGACATLGLAHPPGYPLYIWSCYPFAQLGDAIGIGYAAGAALTSAVAATATCVMVLWLVREMTGSLTAGLLAGGILGLGSAFTSQAQIPEVYTLNAALTAALLLTTHVYAHGGSHRWLWGMGLVTGLGLANHWPLFLISGPASLLWLMPAVSRVLADLKRPPVLGGCLLALVLGLVPYVHLFTVSADAYSFDDNFGTDKIAGYIRRDPYNNDEAVISFPYRLLNTGQATFALIAEFFYVFGVAGLAGFALLARKRNWWRLGGLVWGSLATTALLAFVRPFDPFNDLSRWIQSVYPLPAFFFFSIALGVALGELMARSKKNVRRQVLLSFALLMALMVWQVPTVDRSDDDIALRSSRAMLADVPEDGLAISTSSDYSFPVRFANFIAPKKQQRELRLELGVIKELNYDGSMPLWQEEQLVEVARPLFFFFPLQLKTIGMNFHGLHYSLNHELPSGKLNIKISSESRELLQKLVNMRHGDFPNQFTKLFTEKVLIEAARNLVQHSLINGDRLSALDAALLSEILTTPEGQYGKFITQVLEQKDLSGQQFNAAYQELLPFVDGLSQQWRASVQQIVATVRIQQNNFDGAREILERSIADFPSASNAKVLVDLLQLYALQDDFDEYIMLRKFYPSLDSGKALDNTDKECEMALGVDSCAPI